MGKDLSWKPVQRGDIYCAPACGLGCKRAWFDKATREAKIMVSRLGKGWRPRVWENMGWFASVVFAEEQEFTLQVYLPSRPSENYWIDLHVADRQFHTHADTPEQGIRIVLKEARKMAKVVERGVAALPKSSYMGG